MKNLMPIGQVIMLRYGVFFKMAAIRHLGFGIQVFAGTFQCAKFG